MKKAAFKLPDAWSATPRKWKWSAHAKNKLSPLFHVFQSFVVIILFLTLQISLATATTAFAIPGKVRFLYDNRTPFHEFATFLNITRFINNRSQARGVAHTFQKCHSTRSPLRSRSVDHVEGRENR